MLVSMTRYSNAAVEATKAMAEQRFCAVRFRELPIQGRVVADPNINARVYLVPGHSYQIALNSGLAVNMAMMMLALVSRPSCLMELGKVDALGTDLWSQLPWGEGLLRYIGELTGSDDLIRINEKRLEFAQLATSMVVLFTLEHEYGHLVRGHFDRVVHEVREARTELSVPREPSMHQVMEHEADVWAVLSVLESCLWADFREARARAGGFAVNIFFQAVSERKVGFAEHFGSTHRHPAMRYALIHAGPDLLQVCANTSIPKGVAQAWAQGLQDGMEAIRSVGAESVFSSVFEGHGDGAAAAKALSTYREALLKNPVEITS